MTEQKVYFIPKFLFEKVSSYVAKLGRKAEKLGLEKIELVELSRTGHVVDTETGLMIPIIVAQLRGEMPQLPGWDFIGTVDHGQDPEGNPVNVVRSVVDEIPDRFRSTEKVCEHCGYKRTRKNTFIVRSETEGFKQVGSGCLKDYLGHKDAARVAGYLQSVLELLDEMISTGDSLEEAVEEIESWFRGESKYSGMRVEEEFELGSFLRFTYRAIKANGWVSRSGKGEATADHVLGYLSNPGKRDRYGVKLYGHMEDPIEGEADYVLAVIDWARNLSEDELRNQNYLSNLNAIAQRGTVTWRNSGYAASMIIAFENAQRKAEEKAEKEALPESEFVGEIKKRMNFEGLKLEAVREIGGYYGITYLHIFRDEENNLIVWFNSAGWAHEEGLTYSGKATVAEHKIFNGEKQTIVKRANFSSPDEEE